MFCNNCGRFVHESIAVIEDGLPYCDDDCQKGTMSIEGHTRCGACHGVFPRSWLKDSKTGACTHYSENFCCQKCYGVFLFRMQNLTKEHYETQAARN